MDIYEKVKGIYYKNGGGGRVHLSKGKWALIRREKCSSYKGKEALVLSKKGHFVGT